MDRGEYSRFWMSFALLEDLRIYRTGVDKKKISLLEKCSQLNKMEKKEQNLDLGKGPGLLLPLFIQGCLYILEVQNYLPLVVQTLLLSVLHFHSELQHSQWQNLSGAFSRLLILALFRLQRNN